MSRNGNIIKYKCIQGLHLLVQFKVDFKYVLHC